MKKEVSNVILTEELFHVCVNCLSSFQESFQSLKKSLFHVSFSPLFYSSAHPVAYRGAERGVSAFLLTLIHLPLSSFVRTKFSSSTGELKHWGNGSLFYHVCSNRPRYPWQKLYLHFCFFNANTKRCCGKSGFAKVAFANSAVGHTSKSMTGFRGSWSCSQAPGL